MKQTAVEWLIEQLHSGKELSTIIHKAKAMEKEQIMQSLNDGKGMVLNNIENKSLEQYYKETFKQD